MKKLYPIIILTLFSGCTASVQNNQNVGSPTENLPEEIIAFREVCLKTAPSFNGAIETAKKLGMNSVTDAVFMIMGDNPNHSLAFQVQSNKECAITTPSKSRNKLLTQQFFAAVNEYANTPTQTNPSKIMIKDQSFFVVHDRKDGEAYVITKK